MAIRTGIPMSVLVNEPDEYLRAMFDVLEWESDHKDR